MAIESLMKTIFETKTYAYFDQEGNYAERELNGFGRFFRYLHLYARDTHLKQVASLGQAALFKANMTSENAGKIHALITKAHNLKQQILPAVICKAFLAQFKVDTKIVVSIEPKDKNATFTIRTIDQQKNERTASVTLTSQDKKNVKIIDLIEHNPLNDSFNTSERDSLADITYLFLASLLYTSALTTKLTLTNRCKASNLAAKRHGFINTKPQSQHKHYNGVSALKANTISDAVGHRLIKKGAEKTVNKHGSPFPQLTLDHFSYGKRK
ncbi:MAG: hypothetical protein ACXU9U_00070 [Parachlamydiaceae bacterium]